jgi:hypothetical protein
LYKAEIKLADIIWQISDSRGLINSSEIDMLVVVVMFITLFSCCYRFNQSIMIMVRVKLLTYRFHNIIVLFRGTCRYQCNWRTLVYWLLSKSKSYSCYDRRSVSQYVVVSSSLWNPWPDIIFCLKVVVLSLWGALFDERSGLSPVSHFHQCVVHCQRFNIIYIVHVTCFKYM